MDFDNVVFQLFENQPIRSTLGIDWYWNVTWIPTILLNGLSLELKVGKVLCIQDFIGAPFPLIQCESWTQEEYVQKLEFPIMNLDNNITILIMDEIIFHCSNSLCQIAIR